MLASLGQTTTWGERYASDHQHTTKRRLQPEKWRSASACIIFAPLPHRCWPPRPDTTGCSSTANMARSPCRKPRNFASPPCPPALRPSCGFAPARWMRRHGRSDNGALGIVVPHVDTESRRQGGSLTPSIIRRWGTEAGVGRPRSMATSRPLPPRPRLAINAEILTIVMLESPLGRAAMPTPSRRSQAWTCCSSAPPT